METKQNLRGGVNALAAGPVKIPTDFEKQVASGEAIIVDITSISNSGSGYYPTDVTKDALFHSIENYTSQGKILYYIQSGSNVCPLSVNIYDGGVDITFLLIDETIIVRRNWDDSEDRYQIERHTSNELVLELINSDTKPTGSLVGGIPLYTSKTYIKSKDSINYNIWYDRLQRLLDYITIKTVWCKYQDWATNQLMMSPVVYSQNGTSEALLQYPAVLGGMNFRVEQQILYANYVPDGDQMRVYTTYYPVDSMMVPYRAALFDYAHETGDFTGSDFVTAVVDKLQSVTNEGCYQFVGMFWDDGEYNPLAYYPSDQRLSILTADGSIMNYEQMSSTSYKAYRFNTVPKFITSPVATNAKVDMFNQEERCYIYQMNQKSYINVAVDTNLSFNFRLTNDSANNIANDVVFTIHWCKKINGQWRMTYSLSYTMIGEHHEISYATATQTSYSVVFDENGIR